MSPVENIQTDPLPDVGTGAFVAQPVGQLGPTPLTGPHPHVAAIPWGHNIVLVEKLKTAEERLWYARKTTEHGWSRAVLVHQIETDLHGRQGKAITNFTRTLPSPDSDLVHQLLKDPYNFDFLTLADDADERALERSLIERIRDFLLELGRGFSFIGSQYHLEVSGDDYFLDLFFWHIYQRCYVVIDLKVEDFKPEFAGKMNFYLSAVDDQYRGAHDGPTIGLLLCKTKKEVVVEYALRDTTKPIGVANYVVGKPLPPNLLNALPTEAQLRAELEKA